MKDLDDIARHYGYDSQSAMLMEECSELIQAMSKHRRASGIGCPTPVDIDKAREALIEELADVKFCIEQIKYLTGITDLDISKVFRFKVERQKARIQMEIEAKQQDTSADIGTLDLSVRAYNALKRGGVRTVGDLTERTVEELGRIRGMGKNTLKEITDKLHEIGGELKDE